MSQLTMEDMSRTQVGTCSSYCARNDTTDWLVLNLGQNLHNHTIQWSLKLPFHLCWDLERPRAAVWEEICQTVRMETSSVPRPTSTSSCWSIKSWWKPSELVILPLLKQPGRNSSFIHKHGFPLWFWIKFIKKHFIKCAQNLTTTWHSGIFSAKYSF